MRFNPFILCCIMVWGNLNANPLFEKELPHVSQGQMVGLDSSGYFRLPLLKTEVEARIGGLWARVDVHQVFVNATQQVLEVEYLFPLGERSAVDSMEFRTPNRVIRGVVKLKAQAEEEYQQAMTQGKRAAVLHQVRDNLFRQKMANLMPGDTVSVRISYVEELEFDLSTLRFRFPMTVGPYFTPQDSPSATGKEVQTTYITPETRDRSQIALRVHVLKAPGVALLHSPSHRVRVGESSDKNAWELSLGDGESIPNKDFLLEIPFRNETPQSQLLVEKRGGERFFQYILYPPAVKKSETFPREFIFVVDVSGSMRGFSLNKSKQVMRKILEQMNPSERFQVIAFANQAQSLFAQAMPSTPLNIQQALEFVDFQQGGGGTHFMAAIDQIFPTHQEATTSDRQKLVLFLTDGYIGNEQEIIQSIRDRAQDNRVFTLGVGNSVNHSLLQGMAEAGAGVHAVIRTDGDSERAMRDFYARASAPLLTGFQLQGDGLDLSEVFPKRVAHLTADRPVQISGKWTAKTPVQVKALARLPNGTLWQNRVNPMTVENVGLASLWARKKGAHIQLFEGAIDGREVVLPDTSRQKIESLGLQYQILTPYTSFVAVEEWVANNGQKQERVIQPSVIPEGIDPVSSGAVMLSARSAKMQSGFAEGGGGDLLGGLMGGGSGVYGNTVVTKHANRGQVVVPDSMQVSVESGEAFRSKTEIAHIIKIRSGSLRHIYNRHLKQSPQLSGNITVRLVIGAKGEVIGIESVSSSVGLKDFENEVIRALKRWRWKTISQGEVVVQVPLEFRCNDCSNP